MIAITRPNPDGGADLKFQMYVTHKTQVSLLQDFLQRSRRSRPVYEFRTLADAAQPHEAAVLLDGKEVASGVGPTKKVAKNAAAGTLLLQLAPELKEALRALGVKEVTQALETEFFGDMAIEDFRVSEIAFRSGMFLKQSKRAEVV